MRRVKVKTAADRRIFKNTAAHLKAVNFSRTYYRGGIRL